MQTIIAILITGLATAYAVWRIHCALHSDSGPCAGCEGCALKDEGCKNRKNKCCTEKKSPKNLAI